jgi:hypothetical protein
MVDYRSETATGGRLEGLCPDCDRLIFRRVSYSQLSTVVAGLDVQFSHAQPRLKEGSNTLVNCNFSKDTKRP